MKTQKVEFSYLGKKESTGEIVIRAEIEESHSIFLVDGDGGWLNVFYIRSTESGHMEKMISEAVEKTGISWMKFLAPMNDEWYELVDELRRTIPDCIGVDYDNTNERGIRDALNDYTEVTDEYDGDEVTMLITEWEG